MPGSLAKMARRQRSHKCGAGKEAAKLPLERQEIWWKERDANATTNFTSIVTFKHIYTLVEPLQRKCRDGLGCLESYSHGFAY